MKYMTMIAVVILFAGEVHARGFGAARGGGGRGGVAAGRGGSYVGPRGGSVQAGRVGGVGVGPLGGVHAGGASAARVTTPGGRTMTTGSRGGVSVGPGGGVRASGARGAAMSGPGGRTVAGGSRGAVGVGPFGGVSAGGVRVGGVAGPRGAAVVGHSTHYVSPAGFRSRAAVVRTGGRYGYNCFTPAWYRSHAVIWAPTRWATPTFWVPPAWPTMVTWCGLAATPIYYDYGSDIVINDNYVYVDGSKTVSAPVYAEQAMTLATTGRKADPVRDEEWRPLGVFGLVQGNEEVAENFFQLAVNKAGIVRGNYYDALADNTLAVYGSVDKKTQRVAWSIGDKKDIVFEAGFNNLTMNETTVLVHYGKERTKQIAMVRIEKPDEK